MKKSLNYLPVQKREDLRQLTEIIREEISSCVMVILYGSYARGTYVDYDQRVEFGVPTYFMSDYDILIVTPQKLGVNEQGLYSKINKRFYQNKVMQFHTTPQLINASIKELNYALEKGHYFFCDIKKEGVMLYDSGEFTLARRRKLNFAEIHKWGTELFEEKFETGNSFLRSAGHDYIDKEFKMASFHLHQAAENYLHAVPRTFILYGYKEHNLEKLISYAKSHTPQVCQVFPRDTPEEKRLFQLLQDAYVQARYNKNFVVTREDIDALIPKIELLREIVEKACTEKLAEYNARSRK